MTTSALVNLATSVVENIIVAAASVDHPPPGYLLVPITDAAPGEPGWIYSTATGTLVPPPST